MLALAIHLMAVPDGRVHAGIGEHFGWDLALSLPAGALLVGGTYISPREGDRGPLDGLGHRPTDRAWSRASDTGLVLGLAGATATSALADRGLSGPDRFRGPVVLLESALVAASVNQLAKNLFGVCRPRDWSDTTKTCALDDEARRGFPSGHVAPLAGMAGAALGLAVFDKRPIDTGIAIGTGALAIGVAVARVKAGAHSWVDTGVALVLGSLLGFGVSALHLE